MRHKACLVVTAFWLVSCALGSSFPCGSSFTACKRRARGAKTSNPVLDKLKPSKEAIPLPRFVEFDEEFDEEGAGRGRAVSASAVRAAVDAARREVETLFNRTEPSLAAKGSDPLAKAMLRAAGADRLAKELSYAALIAERAAQQLLSDGASEHQAAAAPIAGTGLEQICPRKEIDECVAGKYRSYSGHCNNVRNPFWGAAYEAMQRLGRADYEDGIAAPRGSSFNGALPTSIQVGKLFSSPVDRHDSCSALIAAFAQFIGDDVAAPSAAFLNRVHQRTRSFASAAASSLPCCEDDVDHPDCFAMLDPEDAGRCVSVGRSLSSPPQNCSKLGIREQLNSVSSYLDGSQIYGATPEIANSLRSFRNGQLSMSVSSSYRLGLPLTLTGEDSPCSGQTRCFRTANSRANLLPSSAAIYTVWMRQHNFVAEKLQVFAAANRQSTQLQAVNPHWNDEKLFQESRRIVIAQLQHITYNEMLPMLVGKDVLRKNGLALRLRGYYSDYDIGVDAGVLNEFAAAANYFSFVLLPDVVQYLDERGRVDREESLRQSFYDPSQLFNKGRLEGALRFLAERTINRPGLFMAADMREAFLSVRGLDLAALVVHAGRDHGLAPFARWRQRCGLAVPRDWREFASMAAVDVDRLASVYASVDDVDLFVGAMAETPSKGALLGPTFGCILAQQFHNMRRGDRFWYENFFVPSAFSAAQLEELRKTTLARVICDNVESGMQLQPHVFSVPDEWGNCKVSCNSSVIASMDFAPWIDKEPQLKLPITKETVAKALKLGYDQYVRVQKEEKRRIDQLGPLPETESALRSHALLMAPKQESLDIARTAGILSAATRIVIEGSALSPEERLPQSLDTATLQQLLPQIDVNYVIGNFTPYLDRFKIPKKDDCLPQPLPCDHTSKYRSFSGWCNNLKFPKYGNAFVPMRRLLDPAYDDGMDYLCDSTYVPRL